MSDERAIRELLEAGGVWRFGRCEVRMDTATGNFYVRLAPGNDDGTGGDDDDRPSPHRRQSRPRRRLEPCAPARRSLQAGRLVRA